MVPRNTRTHAWFLSCLLMLVALALATRPSLAEPPLSSAAPPSAESLTQRLVALNGQYQLASPAAQAGLLTDLLTVAAERQQRLATLIEDHPGEILKLALPDALRAEMPPEVKAYLEQRLELEGTLEVLHVDYKDPKQSHYVYLLKTEFGERYSLHFAAHPPAFLTGARVRVHGLALFGAKARDAGETQGAMALEDGTTSVETLELNNSGSGTTSSSATTTAALPNTLGGQQTLVILVNFQDNPTQPYTAADAQNTVFGITSNFFLENSYQQSWLSGDVVGWFTIASSSTACDTNTIATQAQSAASAAGVNLSGYSHLVYAFPQNYACGWSGLSTVGGSPSQSWINYDMQLGTTGHELGHALGLWHSHLLDCGTTATIGSNCTIAEYGDIIDMMGSPGPGHYNAFQKERLGWLNAGASPPITTVQTGGIYTLDTYELAGSGPKALKILKSVDSTTGAKTWYYVETRQAVGFDTFIANQTTQNVTNGVVVHTGTEGNGTTSDLLDMTPATTTYNAWYDFALVPGQSFQDPTAGMTITTEWVTSTGAAVTVSFNAVQTVPTVAVSTNQASYTRSQTVAVTATVNSGGSPVANASVSFTITKPNGAVVTATGTTGTDGTAVYKLRLRKQDPIGTYQAGAAATANGMSGSGATSFTVQ